MYSTSICKVIYDPKQDKVFFHDEKIFVSVGSTCPYGYTILPTISWPPDQPLEGGKKQNFHETMGRDRSCDPKKLLGRDGCPPRCRDGTESPVPCCFHGKYEPSSREILFLPHGQLLSTLHTLIPYPLYVGICAEDVQPAVVLDLT